MMDKDIIDAVNAAKKYAKENSLKDMDICWIVCNDKLYLARFRFLENDFSYWQMGFCVDAVAYNFDKITIVSKIEYPKETCLL